MASSSERRLTTFFFALALVARIDCTALAAIQDSDPLEPRRETAQILVERMNAYYQLFKNGRYAEAYEMLGKSWRKGPADKQKWIKSTRQMSNGIKILDWHVKAIELADNRAKLRVVLHVRTRESLFKWTDGTEEQNDFWVSEDDNWYYVPMKLDDWDDAAAITVPVPEETQSPMKIEIRTKD